MCTYVCKSTCSVLHNMLKGYEGSFLNHNSLGNHSIYKLSSTDGGTHLFIIIFCCYFFRYCATGWGVPLIPILIAIILDNVESEKITKPYYAKPKCWFNNVNQDDKLAKGCLSILQYQWLSYFLLIYYLIFT